MTKTAAWLIETKVDGVTAFSRITFIPSVADAERAAGYAVSPLYTEEQPTAAAVIRKIAQCADAIGFSAGEPAMELAGQMISVLATHPENIERFMAEGNELFLDGTFNAENGSLTYRSMGGDILSPDDLRRAKQGELHPEEQSLSEAIGLGIGGRGVAEY